MYGEFLTHFLLRGDLEGEEILVPKFGVWTLGYEEEEEEREGDNEGETDGEGEKGEGRVDSIIGKGKGGGLRIVDVKQFYDNAVIGRVSFFWSLRFGFGFRHEKGSGFCIVRRSSIEAFKMMVLISLRLLWWLLPFADIRRIVCHREDEEGSDKKKVP